MEGLENKLWHRWSDGKLGEWAELILQAFNHFTYVTAHAHSPSFQSLHLRHSSFWFSKLSVASPTSQLILQALPCFTYITTHSPTLLLLHLRHSSFSNPSFTSPISQDFHLRHLASRPWFTILISLELINCVGVFWVIRSAWALFFWQEEDASPQLVKGQMKKHQATYNRVVVWGQYSLFLYILL